MLSLHHSPSLYPPTLPSVLHPFFFLFFISHPPLKWRARGPLHPSLSIPLSSSLSLHPSPAPCPGAAMALILTCCQFSGRKSREKMQSGGNNTASGQIFRPPRSSRTLSQFPPSGRPLLLRYSRVTMGAEWTADLMDVFSFVRMPKLSGWVRHFPVLYRLLEGRWRDKERDEEFFVVYDGVMHSFRFLLGASSEMTRFISFAFGVKTGLYLKSALPCNTMADVIIEQDWGVGEYRPVSNLTRIGNEKVGKKATELRGVSVYTVTHLPSTHWVRVRLGHVTSPFPPFFSSARAPPEILQLLHLQMSVEENTRWTLPNTDRKNGQKEKKK